MEALPLMDFPEIQRRTRRRSPIPPPLLLEPPSAEAYLFIRPPSLDLRKSSPSMPMMATTRPPPTTLPTTMSRRSLIGRIVDAVVGLARSVTAAITRTPGNGGTANDVDRAFANAAVDANEGGAANDIDRTFANAAVDANKDEYDAGKCTVGSIRTYCRNCRRYHCALVPLQEE